MVWQLWKTAALLIVLLGITGNVTPLDCGPRPATADISIIGGNEVNIGDKVVIQCSYTGGPALSYPYFTINGDDIEPHNFKAELSNYGHNYTVTFPTGGCAATYNLTLSNVSVEYNGTMYQCYIKPFEEQKVESTTVTLIVGDPATGGTTTDEEGTDGADPSQTTPSAGPPTDAPSYINVVIGSITGVAVYLLTIILIGVVIHFGVKAKKKRSNAHHFPIPPPPPPPPAPPIEMTHNPVYGGAAAPPAYVEHIDFGENRNVLVNMDVMYHDVTGRKSMAVESLYDYIQ